MELSQNKRFSVQKTARKYHKWLMLFLSAQFVIWSVTGTYMVFFDIDYIHGDSLVQNHQTKINPDNIQYTVKQLTDKYPSATDINVVKFIDQEVYVFTNKTSNYMVAANSGELLSPLNSRQAINAAKYYYSGEGKVINVELISDNPPFELRARALPAWRIDFDDFGSPTIYVSAQTGELVGKRHQFWRIFDWMFRLHVMDYDDGADIDNSLLFWLTLFATVAAFCGLLLAYFQLAKTYQRHTSKRKELPENLA